MHTIGIIIVSLSIFVFTFGLQGKINYFCINNNYIAMKLSKLEITNFRCFTKYHIEFAPQVTIIIGRNGAGKTTLINAIHKALSFIFANDRSFGNDFLSAGNPSLKVNSFEIGDYHIDSSTRIVADNANIYAEATYGNHLLSWEIYKRSVAGASLYTSKYKNAFLEFMDIWKNRGEDLPLLSFYSDSFPHRNLKETKYALDTILLENIPRNFGYYQWDVEGACTSIWEYRFNNKLAQMIPLYTPAARIASRIYELETTNPLSQDKVVEAELESLKIEQARITANITPLHEETSYVANRLQKFISGLPSLMGEGYDIDYFTPTQSENGYQLNIVFKNGKSIPMQDLPAGYKRLYSIVFDMAYRSYILNGNSEPKGIVMIDEVDLHLHPSLEQSVIKSLCDTFPNIQFIVSTHSASVISSINTSSFDDNDKVVNRIIFMQEGQTEADSLPNIYGLDYNAVLRDFMGTPSRDIEVKRLMDEYLTFYSLGLNTEADSTMNKILNLLNGDDNHPIIKELKSKRKVYDI